MYQLDVYGTLVAATLVLVSKIPANSLPFLAQNQRVK